MIDRPHNDRECLDAATDEVIAMVQARDPALVEVAEQFGNANAAAAWLRTLPQLDDQGLPSDGPKVAACRPPQRLRFDASNPNCFERAARWIGVAGP